MFTLLTLLVACGSDSELAAKSAAPEEASDDKTTDVRPILDVDYPPRGSFDSSGSGTVQGTVERGSAELTTVTVNGVAADVAADGTFTVDMPWTPGIQILGIRAEDQNGERAVDGRAMYTGPVHAPGAWMSGALRMEIDSDILDDDDPDLDDIAALIEVALEDPALLEMVLDQPLEGGAFVLTPTAISFEYARVDLATGQDILEMEVLIADLVMDFEVEGTGLFSWASTTGSAWMAAAEVGTDLTVVSSGGRIRTSPNWVEADFVGYGLTVDWFPDMLEDELADWTEDFLADTITELASDVLREQVTDALDAFVVEMSLGPGLGIEASLSGLELVPDALRMVIDTRLEANAEIELPTGAGSLTTPGEPPEWPISGDARLGVAVDDDFLNLLGFALWQSGLLHDVEFPGVAVGAMSGEPLPPPFGPAETIQMSLHLPPVVAPPREADLFDADVSIGEWRIKFLRDDGEVLDFSVNLRAGLRGEFMDGTALQVHLDNRPAAIDLEVGVVESPSALDPGDLAALVRLMIPPLIGNSAEIAPNIPIPTIPLRNLVDVDVVDGLELAIGDPEMVFIEGGWLRLRAELEVQ